MKLIPLEALMYSKGSRNIMTEWHVMWFILIVL